MLGGPPGGGTRTSCCGACFGRSRVGIKDPYVVYSNGIEYSMVCGIYSWASKSVEVLSNGIDAVMALTLTFLKQQALCCQ